MSTFEGQGHNDDDIGTLSRIYSAPWTATAASILVGAYANDAVLNARLFHVRKSGWGTPSCPSSALYSDCDGDGLSREIESVLGTCDDSSGPSINCSTTNGRKFSLYASFSPEDSDSDGASDFAEIYGLKKQCQRTPASPLWDAGICTDASLNPNCSYCQKLPLSTMDNPDPTVYDIFVQVAGTSDATGSITGTAHDHVLSAQAAEYLEYTFSVEPMECRDSENAISSGLCPADADLQYNSKIHFFFTPAIPGEILYSSYARAAANAFYNRYFAAARRYSGIFQFLFSDHFYAGSENDFRISIYRSHYPFESPEAADYHSAAVAAHEIGHCFKVSKDTYFPNQVSIGNYFYQANALMARKVGFPSNVGSTCESDVDCPDGVCGPVCDGDIFCPVGNCVDGRCTSLPGVCEIDCGTPGRAGHYRVRFSRGGEPSLNENQVYEEGHSERLAANWWCAVGKDAFSTPSCSGACSIDFDTDPSTPSTPGQSYSYDFNDDGYYVEISDIDEWKSIFDNGKSCFYFSPDTRAFMAYGTSFSASGPVDGSGFTTSTTGIFNVAGPGSMPPNGIIDDPGYSIALDGPASGHYFQIPNSAQVMATGMNVGSTSHMGFSVMLAFKLDTISPSRVSLVRSGHYNTVIQPAGSSIGNLVAWVSGGFDLGGSGTYSIVPNKWYRLVFVDQSLYYGALLISEFSNGGWTEWAVVDSFLGQTAASAPGAVTVGSDPAHQETIDGEIADFELWAYPVCAHWVGDRTTEIGPKLLCEY